jgi:hypothetical protein
VVESKAAESRAAESKATGAVVSGLEAEAASATAGDFFAGFAAYEAKTDVESLPVAEAFSLLFDLDEEAPSRRDR